MWFDEAQFPIWKAGEVVPAGVYVRIDDGSYHQVIVEQVGPLPPSFDGQIACYRAAPIGNRNLGLPDEHRLRWSS